MTFICKFLSAASCLFLVLPHIGTAQADQDTVVHSSIGLRAGYGLPIGIWAESRIAPQVRLFSGSFRFEGDITIGLGQKTGLVIGGGYMSLNGSDWEKYVSSKGDTLRVTGSMTEVSLSLRYYLLRHTPNRIAAEFGLSGTFASGEETFNGNRYTYDFFSTFRLGFHGALEYEYLTSNSVALTLRAAVVIAPDGVKYADGESRTLTYLPFTLGIRFMFE